MWMTNPRKNNHKITKSQNHKITKKEEMEIDTTDNDKNERKK
jgi:hypothetical protein